jgi:uncharacterized protein YndB with AHSA1/START domain
MTGNRKESEMTETAQEAKLKVEAQGDREIRAERIFNAPREKVYRAMTDPDLIPKWWGRHEDTTTVEEIDVRVGGRWRFVTEDRSNGERQGFSGVFRVLDEPERIVQTFEWDGMPGYISVDSAELEDLGDGRTRVVSTSTFHFGEERDGMLSSGMEVGMGESYDRLEELLATL